MGPFPCYGLVMKRFSCFLMLLMLFLPSEAFSAAQKNKVEIFVTSWCPYCKKLEAFLKQSQIDYTRYDVEADAKAAEEFERLGGSGVPMVRVGKIVINGYDPERILAALKAQS